MDAAPLSCAETVSLTSPDVRDVARRRRFIGSPRTRRACDGDVLERGWRSDGVASLAFFEWVDRGCCDSVSWQQTRQAVGGDCRIMSVLRLNETQG